MVFKQGLDIALFMFKRVTLVRNIARRQKWKWGVG